MRHWIKGPNISHRRNPKKPNEVTLTVQGTRNDGTPCFVQETHVFHIDVCSEKELVQAAQKIAADLRQRIETYLHENCTCSDRQTMRCPINHAREEE